MKKAFKQILKETFLDVTLHNPPHKIKQGWPETSTYLGTAEYKQGILEIRISVDFENQAIINEQGVIA